MMVRHCGDCDWYMPLAAGSGVCFADGLNADYKDYWDKACCGWQKNMEGGQRMTCEEHAQRMEQIESKLAALDKRLGTIIDVLFYLTKKMLIELESWEQKQSGIDDGNGTTLASAPKKRH